MIYDTIFQRAGNRRLNSFVFDCMSMSEEFFEIRELCHQNNLLWCTNGEKKGKSWTFNNHIQAYFHLFLFPPGVVRQMKPLIGPLSTVLKLSMRNLSTQGDSGQNIINVHVFVSEFWFWKVLFWFFWHCTLWSCFLNATITFRL